MAELKISLFDLLNLSIGSPGQGAVNFRAMYTLLNGILKHLGIRDVTVRWTETIPCDSSPEPQNEIEEHGQSHKELSADQKGHPGSETPQGTAPLDYGAGGQGTPRDDCLTEETGGNLRQALELLQRLQKQTDSLEDSVKELRLQQEEATGVQSQWVKALEDYNHRVEALEKSMRLPETDELSRYVTWEAMKSALISEREIIQKELLQTKDTNKDTKDLHSTKTEQDRPDAHPSPFKTQTTGQTTADRDSSTETNKQSENFQPLKMLSQRLCGSQFYPETMEALRNIGQLKQRCDSLEARISALDEKKRQDQTEITQLREVLESRGSQDVFEGVRKEMDKQKALVQSFQSEQEKHDSSEEDALMPQWEDSERKQGEFSDGEIGSEVDSSALELLRADVSELRHIVKQLRFSVCRVDDNTKELRAKLQASAEEKSTDQHLQDQLDSLRGMLEDMMVSLTSKLSISLDEDAAVEQGSEMSGFKSTALSLGSKLGLLFQQLEQLQDTVNAVLKQQPATTAGRDTQSTHLVNSVQKDISHLQAECERLHEMTCCLHEDNQQKQTHIEVLYKTTEELKEKKADKNMVETEIRADKSALESKVSRVQFDSATEQLSSMFNELMSKVTDQEQDWNKLMDKLSAEMDCKLDRIELDSVKKQLEVRWKSIQAQMQKQGGLEQDDAAGIKKQLVERFHCLSCDRPVFKHIPGPQLLTLPSSPGLQPHRSMRPFTVYTLEQIRQHYRSERILEVADYSLYSVSRSCGGSHKVKPHNQRRSGLQQNKHPSQLDDGIGQSEEVDIVGLDGHIYKGRLNASPGRNTDTKLPTIATKDGSSKSRDKMRSSVSHRVSPEGPTTPLHPPSIKSPSCCSASCSSGRDWPVSALGCTSQSSIVPMSVNAAGSSTDTPEQAF